MKNQSVLEHLPKTLSNLYLEGVAGFFPLSSKSFGTHEVGITLTKAPSL